MLQKGDIIDDKWEIIQRIGRGSHGTVYRAVDKTDNSEVAIKVEASDVRKKRLQDEHELYEHMIGYAPKEARLGIARPLHYEERSDHKLLVLEFLGPSLLSIFNFQGCRFNLKTILMLFKGLLQSIQNVHRTGVVHRDLKPANLCMGRGRNAHVVHVIDYSVAKRYEEQEPMVNKFVGTTRYASTSAHIGASINRKDDLESICYIMMFLYKGRLPWSQKDNLSLAELNSYVRDWKMKPLQEVCEEYPSFFRDCLEYLRTIKFNEDPDYSILIGIVQNVMKKMNYVDDGVYEWFNRSDGSVMDCSEDNINKRYDDIISFDQTPSPTPSNGSGHSSTGKDQTEEHKLSLDDGTGNSASLDVERSFIGESKSTRMITETMTDEFLIKKKDKRRNSFGSSKNRGEGNSFSALNRQLSERKPAPDGVASEKSGDVKKKPVHRLRRIIGALLKQKQSSKKHSK